MPEFLTPLLWIAGVVTAIGVVAGGALAVRGIYKRIEAIGEAVLGKPEVRDFSGAVIEDAVPSIQARVSSLEEVVKDGNKETSRTDGRVSALEQWRDDHTRETDAMVTRLMDHVLGESEK